MSDTEVANPPRQYAFTVALTLYSTVKPTSKGRAATKRQEKTVKTKELLFALDKTNYLDFLESILEKHGKSHYKVSAKQRFSFKFVTSKTKSQRASEAMDVDNEADYKEMVQKIVDIGDSSTTGTKIFVDMKHIEKLPAHQANDNSGDDESDLSDNNKDVPPTTSDLDARLARWRIKLNAKYKNDHDEGLTYLSPSGTAIPLTPAMVLDWARALDEGQATLQMPPNLPSFDVANKATFLHPVRKAQAAPPPPSTPGPDLNTLTSALILQTLANTGLFSQLGAAHSTPPAPVPSTPVTPPRHTNTEKPTSPPIPSPSQLSRFLKYAKSELHVHNATAYERKLAEQHIGPDIFNVVDDKTLLGIGIPMGDIVRLKQGSMAWWNGPEAKRKRSDTNQSTASRAKSPSLPPQKKVAYEKKYHGGGGFRFTAPPMIPGDDDAPKDYDLWYESTDHNAWLPVPHGFIVCEEEEDDFNFFN